MKMKWRAFSKLGKDFFSVLLIFSFLSSCFVKSKFDNPTDGVGGLLLEGLSVLYAVSEANITVSGILKDSAGSVVPSGILDISRSGSANSLQRASADSKVYSDANGRFSMNVYQGSFTVKVSRSDGTSVGSFSIKVSSATATPEVLSSSGLQVSGLSAAPVGTAGGGTPTISISNTPNFITEGSSVNIGIKILGSISSNVTLSIKSSNSSITLSKESLVFTPDNNNLDQSLTLSAIEDENLVSESVTINIIGDGLTNVSLTIISTDNDTQNFIVTNLSTIDEGGTASLGISLSKEPNSNVSVTVMSSNSSSVTVNGASFTNLIFTPLNYKTQQVVNLASPEDSNETSETVTISVTSNSITTNSQNLIILDNDIRVVFGSYIQVFELLKTGSIGISLSGNPGIDRTLSFTLNSSDYINLSSNSLIFSSSDWSVQKTITLSGIIDNNIINDQVTLNAIGSKIVSSNYNVIIKDTFYNIKLLKTGISTCYNIVGSISCGDTDYPLQDGDIQNGLSQSFIEEYNNNYPNDIYIKDNNTALLWKKCDEGKTGNNCQTGSDVIFTNDNASIKCNELNLLNSGSGYAGRINWRLPFIYELRTLVNYSLNNPAINVNFFPNTKSGLYWSATSNSTRGYSINFSLGNISAAGSTNSYSIKCVSGVY